jgi:ferredoxin-NADP reductase
MIATFPIKLEERFPLTEHVYLMRFAPVNHQLDFKPGQYVILHIPQADGHPARRLYSIASPESQKQWFELLVEIIPDGVASGFLMNMKIGETVTAQGPAGMFFLKPEPMDTVFLATGTGIAPIRSMIRQLIDHHSDKKIFLFWGFPTMDTLYLQDEFKQIARTVPNFFFMNCMSREKDLSCVTDEFDKPHFGIGHINDGLETIAEISQNLNNFYYYICGGPKVVESMREYLASKQIPKENIHFEKFTL